MVHWRIWEEEMRGLPHGGAPTTLWVVRREGPGDGPLRLLCGWSSDGRPAPLPLGLIYRTVQAASAQETTGDGRAGRPLACLALPLRAGEMVVGALALGYDPAPPWGEAARTWADGAAARLGPLVTDLEPWPGTWMSDPPATAPWQPALFTPEELPGGRRPAGPRREGLLLPRPRLVPGLPGMVGQSKEILLLSARLATVAVSGVNVLLVGESGTGKELVASAIHLRSARRDGPFIGLNCAALPESRNSVKALELKKSRHSH